MINNYPNLVVKIPRDSNRVFEKVIKSLIVLLKKITNKKKSIPK